MLVKMKEHARDCKYLDTHDSWDCNCGFEAGMEIDDGIIEPMEFFEPKIYQGRANRLIIIKINEIISQMNLLIKEREEENG